MRLARGSATGAQGRAASAWASPYRAPAEVEPDVDAPRPRAAQSAAEVAAVGFVLGCSLLRFGLFALRPERFGVDPALALAASAASAYTLARVLGR